MNLSDPTGNSPIGVRATGADVFYVGNVRITRIEERVYSFPITEFIPEATPQRMSPHMHWLAEFGVVDIDTMTMPVNGYLLESQGLRVLVDTCVGLEHSDSEPTSPFVDRLRGAGIDPDSIDAVVCTHFHYDHVGWNTTVIDGVRTPTFRNARYVFSGIEWEASKDGIQRAPLDGMLQESFDKQIGFIVQSGRADLVDDCFALTPEVSLLDTPGHSPGHVSILIGSDGQEAILTGDAIHHPFQIAETDAWTKADSYPRQTTKSRERLIDRAADRDVLVIGSHFGSPGRGFVRTEAGRPLLVPVRADA